jgi:hypothetical protein
MDDRLSVAGAVVALLALPVTAIAKAVSLSKDVEANRSEAAARMAAHETLCEERQRNILSALARIEERL